MAIGRRLVFCIAALLFVLHDLKGCPKNEGLDTLRQGSNHNTPTQYEFNRIRECNDLGLPQSMVNIPLSPKSYRFDHSITTIKYFVATADRDVNPPVILAFPTEPRLLARLSQNTGRVGVRNNGNIWNRVKESKAEDGIFIDVGGWVGDTSIPSAAAGIDTYVFEPVRMNCNLIHIAMMSNGCRVEERLTIVNALVGDHNSRNESIYVTADRSDNAAYTKELATANIRDKDNNYDQPVEMIALDSFFPSGTKVQNLKIDVQGFELSVLRGAERLLTENKEGLHLRFEHNEKILRAGGTNPSDVIDYVKNLGYEMVRKDGDDLDW
eukprot:CAMPEP_0172540056 /NCGR_PEP_ID=MMETSP1067-20121228/11135_1 /TAXON_ID=265564 ORGANISM="Thalassiosira punctigera, Strain Tpunct2005C2" /NCGR_SAMPLE_ID=MMETSP1067 /ASSEMBLY_ACC=CAM_ASM_000444 /LENGTH=323 /DNA_ID=CAMNT_0013325837 /DNA_START=45 /DNA_END=1013 /DNA_ORIENTATION=+